MSMPSAKRHQPEDAPKGFTYGQQLHRNHAPVELAPQKFIVSERRVVGTGADASSILPDGGNAELGTGKNKSL